MDNSIFLTVWEFDSFCFIFESWAGPCTHVQPFPFCISYTLKCVDVPFVFFLADISHRMSFLSSHLMPPAIVELILSNPVLYLLFMLAPSLHKASPDLPSSSQLVRELELISKDENGHLVPCHTSKQEPGRMKKLFLIPQNYRPSLQAIFKMFTLSIVE